MCSRFVCISLGVWLVSAKIEAVFAAVFDVAAEWDCFLTVVSVTHKNNTLELYLRSAESREKSC